MDIAAGPTITFPNKLTLAEAVKIAEARFEAAVQGCKDNWMIGHNMVILQDSIPQLFGGILVEHFKRCVAEVSGLPVELTVMDEGDNNYHTLVQMPKNSMCSPHVVSSPQSSQASTSEDTTVDMSAVASGLKKAPRPMNCWIIFRDAMHKHLKAEFPHLTIQEISTRCSLIWHNMSDEAKKPWQDAAQSAKEEHLRRHPDYKYSPRKPGEKKKRQSRKSKRAAAMATAPEVLQFQLSPTLISVEPEISDNAFTAGTSNAFPETQYLGSMPSNSFYDAEAARHEMLETEFGNDFNMTTFFNDDMFAFQDRAVEDAALPAIFQEMY